VDVGVGSHSDTRGPVWLNACPGREEDLDRVPVVVSIAPESLRGGQAQPRNTAAVVGGEMPVHNRRVLCRVVRVPVDVF